MENPMGFAHFLAQSDFVARGVLALMLLASIGTWTLIATKGFRLWRVQRQSASFLSAFWAAPNLEAVAARIRENGANEPFSHLVHHGFTAIEQNNRRQRGEEQKQQNCTFFHHNQLRFLRALHRRANDGKGVSHRWNRPVGRKR